MAVEEQVVALLRADPDVAAIVGPRIYAMPAPQAATTPFLTYQVISVQRSGMTYDAHSVHDITSMQIDCWADPTTLTNVKSRADQIQDLARAVRAALDRQGLVGEDVIDLILWQGWSDLTSPTEIRRALDFDLYVRSAS